MQRSRGTSTIQLIFAFTLVVGLIALAYFAGTATCGGPFDPLDRDDAARLGMREGSVVGYLSIEPRGGGESFLKPGEENADYTGLAIELRTHASLLKTGTLMTTVLGNPSLELRNTKWFKSFAHPVDAQRWLERHLHAYALTDSKIIKVWLDPIDSKSEAKAIIMDIVNAHLEEQRKITHAKSLDRQSALNTLKIKYENRIRELTDRQNNLLVRLDMSNVGAASRTTATDIELNQAITQQGALALAAAHAKAKFDVLQADAKDDANRSDVRAAEMDMKIAAAALDANQRRIESLRGVLGDRSIAMHDYLSTQDELAEMRASVRGVRDQLDIMSSSVQRVSIGWAQYPTAGHDE